MEKENFLFLKSENSFEVEFSEIEIWTIEKLVKVQFEVQNLNGKIQTDLIRQNGRNHTIKKTKSSRPLAYITLITPYLLISNDFLFFSQPKQNKN